VIELINGDLLGESLGEVAREGDGSRLAGLDLALGASTAQERLVELSAKGSDLFRAISESCRNVFRSTDMVILSLQVLKVQCKVEDVGIG
jgi:uncharacterized protein YcfJ